MIADLVTKFSFAGNLKPLKDYNDSLGKSIKLLSGFSIASAGALGGMVKWTSSMVESIAPTIDSANALSITTAQLQELTYAADQNGVSQGILESSLRRLTKRAGDTARGIGVAGDAYQELGISVLDSSGALKDGAQLLAEIQAATQGMEAGRKISLMDKLGIDRKAVNLVNLSASEMAELTAEAREFGVLSEEDAKAIASYGNSLTKMRYAMEGARRTIAVGLAPAFQDLISGFAEMITANKEWISAGLLKLGNFLKATIGLLKRTWPLIVGLGVAFAAAAIPTGAFGTVLNIALSPVTLITAAIVTLILIVDDLITAFQGGESVIANFFKNAFGIDIVPIMQGMLDYVFIFFDKIMGLIDPLLDAFVSLWRTIAAAFSGDFDAAFDHFLDAISNLLDFVSGLFASAIDGWLNMFSWMWQSFKDTAYNVLSGLWDWVKESINDMMPDWLADLLDIDKGTALHEPVPLSNEAWRTLPGLPEISPDDWAAAVSQIQNNNGGNVSQTNAINVYSSDPQAAGQAVADRLEVQMKNANYIAGRGGL